MWDATNAVTRRILVTLDACIIKIEWSQINNLSFTLKKLEKAEWDKPRTIRRKEIRREKKIDIKKRKKMRIPINETENRKIEGKNQSKLKLVLWKKSIKMISL